MIEFTIQREYIVCVNSVACGDDHVETAEEIDLELWFEFGTEIECHATVCIDIIFVFDLQIQHLSFSRGVGDQAVLALFHFFIFRFIICQIGYADGHFPESHAAHNGNISGIGKVFVPEQTM